MEVTLWGTRGSLATPGPEMARYGGNTSCVGVRGQDGTVLVLDAGTGIRRFAKTIPASVRRVDILLTHLHMDHILGLGFFGPLYNPEIEVHIWGPASSTQGLQARLKRYLSPPLFPVRLNELPCKLHFHEVPRADVDIGEFRVSSSLVCHPGPTVGYRIASPSGKVLTYLPDHEPALGALTFPALPREWTSGAMLAADADLLIHDSQYSAAEYGCHCGSSAIVPSCVVRSSERKIPRCPPASSPWAMTASTPLASSQSASCTVVADEKIIAPHDFARASNSDEGKPK